uniref:Acidic protein n=1 Tax=Oryza glumipatula TaxID=40148 RepID=A0A0D9YLT9_9ORYZ
MEVKKVAMAAVCCMFILLFPGQQQQVAAMSRICRCYHECLPNCGLRNSRSFCKVFCGSCCVFNPVHNCTSTDAAAAALAIAGDDCRMICLNSFCGEAATGYLFKYSRILCEQCNLVYELKDGV